MCVTCVCVFAVFIMKVCMHKTHLVIGVVPDLVQLGLSAVIDVDHGCLLQVLPLCQVTVTLAKKADDQLYA